MLCDRAMMNGGGLIELVVVGSAQNIEQFIEDRFNLCVGVL